VSAALRLFVSSTFRDMQAERDALARHCFPAARRRFAQAGTGFVEVDLRWGLQVGESEERIVQLCLQEVDRCAGCFVGILGARYGYVPGQRPPAPGSASAAADWPEAASITEYEVRAGAFAKPATGFVRFYFRQPGLEPDEPPMQRLKQEIVARGFAVRMYASPGELASLLLADLGALADAVAARAVDRAAVLRRQAELACRAAIRRPELESALDAWLAGGSRRLAVRGPSGAGKSSALASWWLRQVATAPVQAGAANPVAAAAAPGWRQRLGGWLAPALPATPPTAGVLWLVHFAGAETGEGRFGRMLDALLAGCASPGQPAVEPGPSLGARLGAWHQAVAAACQRHRQVVVVIDGVDDLHLDAALPFHWLPPDRPNLRLLLSGRDAGPAATLAAPAWQALAVGPLLPAQRGQALAAYLHDFGKTLPPPLAQRLADSAALANPGALRLLADELRLTRTPEHLLARSEELAQARSGVALVDDMLGRLEAENGRALVADACCLLLLSRGGLPESELRVLLGERHALPAWQWAGLMESFRRSVFDRDGRLAAFDEALRVGIRQRYLGDAARLTELRSRLVALHGDGAGAVATADAADDADADTGAGASAKGNAKRTTGVDVDVVDAGVAAGATTAPRRPAPRAVEELPWQLWAAQDWAGLHALLSRADFMAACWRAEPDQARRYWQALLAAAGPQALAAAARAWRAQAGAAAHGAPLALLLTELGAWDEAVITGRALLLGDAAAGSGAGSAVDFAADTDTAAAPARDLLLIAALLVEARRWPEAGEWLDAAERRSAAAVAALLPAPLRATAFNTRGNWLLGQGRHAAAGAAFAQAEALHHEAGDALAAAQSRLNRALALAQGGQAQPAQALIQACTQDFERLHDLPSLITADLQLASLAEQAGRLKPALRHLERPAQLARQAHDGPRLAQVLALHAGLVEQLGDRDAADRAQAERQGLLRTCGDRNGELDALLARVAIRLNLGPRALGAARRLLQEAELLALQATAAGGAASPGAVRAETLARLAQLRLRAGLDEARPVQR
jgi:hypothetical protein